MPTSTTCRVAALGRALASAPAVAALLMAGACTTNGDPVAPGTGLEVRVLKGPIQPVEVEGGGPTVAPVEGAVVVVRPEGGGRVRRASTDPAGVVQVPLPPGTWRVSLDTCPGTMWMPEEPERAEVVAGAVTTVEIVCDTGIR